MSGITSYLHLHERVGRAQHDVRDVHGAVAEVAYYGLVRRQQRVRPHLSA